MGLCVTKRALRPVTFTSKDIAQGIFNFAFPLLCGILEVYGIDVVLKEHESICIQAHEIHRHTQTYLVLISMVIVPDFIFSVMVIFDLRTSARSFAIAYHVLATIICSLAAGCLHFGITYCGNLAQHRFHFATDLAVAATFLHVICAIVVVWEMDLFPYFKRPDEEEEIEQ